MFRKKIGRVHKKRSFKPALGVEILKFPSFFFGDWESIKTTLEAISAKLSVFSTWQRPWTAWVVPVWILMVSSRGQEKTCGSRWVRVVEGDFDSSKTEKYFLCKVFECRFSEVL